jgi:hypothetical protein
MGILSGASYASVGGTVVSLTDRVCCVFGGVSAGVGVSGGGVELVTSGRSCKAGSAGPGGGELIQVVPSIALSATQSRSVGSILLTRSTVSDGSTGASSRILSESD